MASGEIREHPGGKEIPHDGYIRLISERDAPIERVYIKSRDGLYVAAAVRRLASLKAAAPVLVYFHGAPGGRGMEKLVSWASGETGTPVFERFVREGYALVVADYRNTFGRRDDIVEKERATYVDDGLAVVEWVRQQPWADVKRIAVYGVSRGGNLAAHLIGRTRVGAAVLGAPAVAGFLGVEGNPRDTSAAEYFGALKLDPEMLKRNVDPISTPVLVLVGRKDSLYYADLPFYKALDERRKRIDMEVYENGYHDFCIGPQGHAGFHQPLMDSTLDALERTLEWLKKEMK